MIKATIQNIPYCTEIVFPCTETELSKKLGELGMNPEHLAPIATVIEIEPSELTVLTDCDVSLDALNYLGKRLDGMDEREYKQFLAALSCPKISEVWGLKNIINLTDNLARFTLVEDTNDVECVGRIHMLNVRGGLSESEYTNSEWLIAEGTKLLESGKGIDTEYGKLFINEDIPFEEKFNGTTLPPYLYNGSPVTVDIGYMGSTEMVELWYNRRGGDRRAQNNKELHKVQFMRRYNRFGGSSRLQKLQVRHGIYRRQERIFAVQL